MNFPNRPTRVRLTALVLAGCAASGPALATNGMLLEGYGPIAAGMGGAATAVDNGLAAATNNPATLALGDGRTRLDLAVGMLGPRVSSSAGSMKADSGGTSYVMPAFGWGRRSGALTYGLALFAQGGMGTEYGADTFLALGSGNAVRSELGVGRLILPVAWQVNDSLSVGASLDLVWASLDLRLAATGAQLGGMVTGASGNLAMALPALAGAPWARVDFSDDNDFSGSAKSTGTALKLGLVWKATPSVTLGLSHHFESRLGDIKTGARAATLSAPGFGDAGRISVIDFQMPAQTSVGMAWQATPSTLLALDVKRIGWSSVMDSFRMRYDSADMGGTVSFALPQRWEDQTVLQFGVSQTVGGGWTLRAGANLADNPVPAAYVNPLFPAIVKNHLTLGAGLAFDTNHSIDAALSYAPRVSVNTPSGVVVSHRQLNLQAMYSRRF